MFWQILLVVYAVVLAVWILGVGFVSVFHPRSKGTRGGNFIIGIPLAAVAIWLPFEFGWIS